MLLQEALPRYVEAFLRLFYPSRCASCEALLDLDEKGLCSVCTDGFRKLRLPPSEERIRVALPPVDEAWALFPYEGVVKELLHRVKFGGRRDLLSLFLPEIKELFHRRPGLSCYEAIVPIPQDTRRRLEREFNQSDLLAREVGGILGKVRETSLLKKRATPPQRLLGREERRLNIERAFSIPRPDRATGRSFLLIDDIFTTGATLEEAARLLKESGAERVGAFVLARTPHR